MQKNELHFVVVCGYGCNIESPLTGYLNRVAEFLSRRHAELVILCGGETQKKSFPRKSEASVMSDYLFWLSKTWHTAFAWEDDSYTTYDNIKMAASRIGKCLPYPEKCKITIFCEAQRDLSVEMVARHFMQDLVKDVEGDIRTEPVSWERQDPARALWKANMMWLALKFPILAQRESRKNRRKSENR